MMGAKKIFEKFVALLLLVVLCVVSVSESAYAAPLSYKNIRFYFRNMKTEEEKQIIKDHFYFYNVTTNEYIYLTDENLSVNDSGQHTGCFYYEFERVPLDTRIQLMNSDGMVICDYDNENGANIYYPVITFNLYASGTIINTIYGYGVGIYVPYDGTEAVLQKENMRFIGWYSSYGQKLADAQNGYLWLSSSASNVVDAYARWTTHFHDWATEWSSNNDEHWHECNGDGTCEITSNTEKNGYAVHDFSGEGSVITEPTCEEKGEKRINCSQEGCPAYQDEDIDPLNHLEETQWSYDSDNHWKNCSREDCNEKLNNNPHEMGEWVTVREATFNERGSKKRECIQCDYEEIEHIPARVENHNHDFSGAVENMNIESCIEKGLKRIHCIDNDCSEYIEQEVQPLGHLCDDKLEYDEKNHYKVCKRCKIHEMEELHTYGQWKCIKEATSKENGIEVCACITCGYEINRAIEYVEEETKTERVEETTTKHEEEETTKEPIEETTTESIEEETTYEEVEYEEEPVDTSDSSGVKIYATMAMVAGFTYVLAMFGEKIFGMSKEYKDDIVSKLIKWGKNRNQFIKGIAIICIFFVLLYYHAIGKKIVIKDIFDSIIVR